MSIDIFRLGMNEKGRIDITSPATEKMRVHEIFAVFQLFDRVVLSPIRLIHNRCFALPAYPSMLCLDGPTQLSTDPTSLKSEAMWL